MELGNPIAKGNTANIYLVENKVVKVFKEHLPENEALKEAWKQDFARSCGLPVPEIRDVKKIDGKQAIIMEYVQGKTLGELYFEGNREQAEEYMKISIDIQQQIHSIKPVEFEPMSDKLQRQIQSAPRLDQNQKGCLENLLNSMEYENSLCHGDFHLYNLIMADDKVTIIDWVDSSAGDFRADVYRTYLLYSTVSTELAEEYLTLYCDESGLSRAEVFKWAPIIAGARLSEHVSNENEERLKEIVKSCLISGI
ncbi:phosphotransferase family protein [Bacillus salacetis]|uniref:phosphotransferase family protein n=1 Tax=Bacillus salacetis TaxID=2315464 RepID=UPI003B9E8C0A